VLMPGRAPVCQMSDCELHPKRCANLPSRQMPGPANWQGWEISAATKTVAFMELEGEVWALLPHLGAKGAVTSVDAL